MNTNLSFACDYMEGCHPAILEKLTETNLIKTPGYGLDDYTRSACEKITASALPQIEEIEKSMEDLEK